MTPIRVSAPGGRLIGVLISGRGSNLQAIISAVSRREIRADIAIVISNRADAEGLKLASAAGIETLLLDHTDRTRFRTREDYDRELVKQLEVRKVDLVCLAGFMRLLSPIFVQSFPATLNIHPSLLPAFPGMNAQVQAWEYGVKFTGVTVHLVTADLDGGPIVLQEIVPVLDEDDTETLARRILEREHCVYPEAIRIVLDGGWRIEGRRFIPAR